MYKCDRCGQTVSDLNTYRESYPYGSTSAKEIMVDYQCRCGGQFWEANTCNICGDIDAEENMNFFYVDIPNKITSISVKSKVELCSCKKCIQHLLEKFENLMSLNFTPLERELLNDLKDGEKF